VTEEARTEQGKHKWANSRLFKSKIL